MCQYITTKTLGPTNTKGTRVKASASYAKCTKTLPWDYALDADKNHGAAAKALAESLNWPGRLVAGHGPDGNVYVFDNNGAV
jgi:hypothetical protein